MKIQLLTFPGCPNAGPAREALRVVLAALGLPPGFEEVDVSAAGTPEALRAWPSPTVLVDGRDALGQPPGAATGCRVGAALPTETALRAAIGGGRLPRRRGFW